jgi:hypothetical protein
LSNDIIAALPVIYTEWPERYALDPKLPPWISRFPVDDMKSGSPRLSVAGWCGMCKNIA